MTREVDFDVLVVGGGPAGATTAILLARAGWRVAIAERSAFPRRKVCGEFVSAPSWPLLRALGIEESSAGPAVQRVGLYAGDVTMDVPMPAAHHGSGHALGRDVLDTVLLGCAARSGAEVLQPCTVRSIERAPHGHVCTTDTVQRVRARIVVAAHGSWEPGPLPTQPRGFVHGARDLIAFKAHFRHARLAPHTMPLVLFPGGYGGMVQADDGRVSLSCCMRRDRLAQCRWRYGRAQRAGDAVLAHIVASSRGVRDALRGATREGAWLAAGPIRPGLRCSAEPAVLRVGNAMGEAHPIVAEGIGMAIQSAWLLCTLLTGDAAALRGRHADAALRWVQQAYMAAWRRTFAPRVHAAAVFAALAVHEPTRNLMSAAVRCVPGMLALGARWSGKTRIAPA